jgi:hypothetical protein
VRGAGGVRGGGGNEDADDPEAMEAVMKRRDTCLAIAILCASLLGGCVMHTVTRGDSDVAAHTIYKVSEEEAFTTILDIFAVEMPKQSIDDVV